MTEELKKAIDLIEEAGGIVMMADSFDEDGESRDDYLARLEAEEAKEKEQLEQWQKERKETLTEMAKDFDKMLNSKDFSYDKVEDMVHGYGCDMDDLEDLIHNFY